MSKLSAEYIDEMLHRQSNLQIEARYVVEKLDLISLLGRVGRVEQFGSSVSGLMVWRDIDFNVYSPDLTIDEAYAVIQPLLTHPRVVGLLYMNEHGHRNPTGRLRDDRFFFAVTYETDTRDEWKIDISFWLLDAPHNELDRLQDTFARYLTDETRAIILWLKDLWHRLPCYPYQVSGTDIYYAVLEHGVRNPEQFKAYLSERNKPVC